jgi:putative CocE/NonD family hydrolase
MWRRDLLKSALGGLAMMATPFRSKGAERSGWRLPPKGPVRMVENSFIAMPDGVRLAVQLWLPEGAAKAPLVLEYIPYRKRDLYRAYDLFWGQTLAQFGIAYARLETRGSGDSEGLLADEYLPSEQHDAVAAIAWLARQPWCNGSVGMRGVSWGGFSTLQAAALAPPALKAIMPMCASDMRYTDDAHYVGGVFALTGLKWATSFKLVMAGPPDPEISGPAWLAQWRARLAATPPVAARWLSHQTNDAYWRQGSVALDWDAIKCPVYVVGGLVDSYSNAIPRLLEYLKVPRKGLLGPWQHGYPAPATPGPGLDWAFEEVRWWRHWLLGEETGIMDEPMLRVFMPEATAAQVSPGPIPGRWVSEPAWPAPAVSMRRLHLGRGGLHEAPQAAETKRYRADRIVGLGKVEWVPFAPTELPREQSADDACSLVFETPPLAADLEILGAPVFHVRVISDRPAARIAARLNGVSADGQSWLVSYGLLNLTHRDGHERPEPMAPGRFHEMRLPLNFTAHRFRAGERIRLAVSESLWPLVWPSPQIPTLTIDVAASSLELPVRSPPEREAPMPFALAAPSPPDPKSWPTMEISLADGAARVVETWPPSETALADIAETLSGSGPDIVLTMTEGDPLSCQWRAEQTAGFRRPGWDVGMRAEVSVRSDASHFHVSERLTARLNGEVVADVAQDHAIPREGM